MAPLREDQLPAAKRIFVDRTAPQELFAAGALAIPPDRSKLLVFYDAGGQGKTALCEELWRKTNPTVDPRYDGLRRAQIDLHGRQIGDPDLLLVWIRNGFAEAGVSVPAFDLALLLTWKATRGEQPFPELTRPWLKRTTAAAKGAVEEAAGKAKELLQSDTVTELLGEAVSEIPGVGFVVKWAGGRLIEKTRRAYLEHRYDFLKELYDGDNLKKPHELLKLLPWMLAQNLNRYLGDHPNERLVLFIDEYERVFAEGAAGAQWRENAFDNQLRTLLQYTKGLLAVFFSRERLPWEEDPDWRDDLIDRQHLLGGLAYEDADEFLRAIPIESADVRRTIIDGARETSGAVYPLMLNLQVEHWRTIVAKNEAVTPARFKVSEESFEGRRRELIARVLRGYGGPFRITLERLSVARRFDQAAFEHVVKTFGTGLPLDIFDRITELSFVTRTADGFVTIHNVIAEVIRQTLKRERRQTSVESLFEHYALRASVKSPAEVTDATITALFEAAFLRRVKGLEGYTTWLAAAARPVFEAARHSSAAQLWREALENVETSLGSEHCDTATCRNNLAVVLWAQGDLAGARPLLARALAIREKILGPEHPDTATSLHDFGVLLGAQGDLAEARRLFERALAIFEKASGPEHPDTAMCLNDLGSTLRAQGHLAQARPLYERALAIYEKVLGPEHCSTATSLNNLGSLLQAQDDFAEARPLLERALAIYEKVLGPEHPNTATTVDHLAALHRAQGDLTAAQPLYKRALAIREKALGPWHPDTATGLNNLASLLQDKGDLAEARPLYERALAICEKVLGPEHPDTATSLNNLGSLLSAQGDLTRARPLLERAVAIYEKVLGPDHPLTGTSLFNLASVLSAQGDLTGARPLLERGLAIQEEVLSPEHPDAGTSLFNLASVLSAQGDPARAAEISSRRSQPDKVRRRPSRAPVRRTAQERRRKSK